MFAARTIATLAAVTAVAAGAGVARAALADDIQVVNVVANDYAFQMPDTVRAGATEFRLVNQGKELHHIQLIYLAGGRTLKDVFTALQAGGPPPSWAVEVGGPNAHVPGVVSSATLELKPGRYAVLCLIPSPDGKPHVMKGMAKEMVVLPGKGAAAPKPTIEMTLTDYDFTLSAPLTAGTHHIAVRNTARQPHEVFFAKLAPGKTARDVVAWAEKPDGPPPGIPLGGTTGIARGEVNIVPLTLEPGEYAMICFLPDAGDGKPHFVHGMMKQFTVK